jgi:hypothetical protein
MIMLLSVVVEILRLITDVELGLLVCRYFLFLFFLFSYYFFKFSSTNNRKTLVRFAHLCSEFGTRGLSLASLFFFVGIWP